MILEKMAAKDGCNAPLTMAPMVPTSKYGHSETLRRITSKNDTVGTCSSCKNRGTDGGSSSEKHWSYEEKRGPFSNVKSNIRFCPFRNMVDMLTWKKEHKFLLWYWIWSRSPPLAWACLSPVLVPLFQPTRSLVWTEACSNCSCHSNPQYQLPPYPWPPERSVAQTEPQILKRDDIKSFKSFPVYLQEC